MASSHEPAPETRARLPLIAGSLGAVFLIALMVHTVLNAILRSGGVPIEGTLEYSGFWYMPAIAFLGFCVAQHRTEHIEASLIYDRMPMPVQRYYDVIIGVVVLVLCLVLAWFGLQEAIESYEIRRTSGSSSIPIWPATFFVPLGLFLMAIQQGLDLRALITRSNDEHIESPLGKEVSL